MAKKKSIKKKPKSKIQRKKSTSAVRRPRPTKKISLLETLLKLIPSKAWSGLGVLAFVVGVFSFGSKILEDHSSEVGIRWETFEDLQNQSPTFQERMAYWSGWLETIVQKGGKVPVDFFGQKPQIDDSAPLVPERFDCTTFVETVAALSMSEKPTDFYKRLLEIRYNKSDARFEMRNHFPESDWIANNQKNGILKDITLEVAQKFGLAENFEQKTLYKNRWLSKQTQAGKVNRALASTLQSQDASWNQPISVKVPYISMREIPRILDRIPQGTIVNLVRKNDERFDVLISHQGIVIHQNGQTMLRHSSVKGVVQTVPLMTYLNGQAGKPWPVIGINLNQFIN